VVPPMRPLADCCATEKMQLLMTYGIE